jgi:hypothetical protein
VIGVHTLSRWLFPGVLQGIVKTHQSNIQRTEVIVLVLCFLELNVGGADGLVCNFVGAITSDNPMSFI